MDAAVTIAGIDAALATLTRLWAANPSVEAPVAQALLPAIVELHAARKRLVRLNLRVEEK